MTTAAALRRVLMTSFASATLVDPQHGDARTGLYAPLHIDRDQLWNVAPYCVPHDSNICHFGLDRLRSLPAFADTADPWTWRRHRTSGASFDGRPSQLHNVCAQ